jgi:hypothetical protein
VLQTFELKMKHEKRIPIRSCYRGQYLEIKTVNFTRELFLRVPDVHIYLAVRGKPLFKCS